MSLPHLFLFWVVAEQNGNESGGCCTLSIFNLVELNLHPRPCPGVTYFCAERDVNLPIKFKQNQKYG